MGTLMLRRSLMLAAACAVLALPQSGRAETQTINAVETDKYDPSLPLALRMAKLFGLAVPELFVDHWEPEEE